MRLHAGGTNIHHQGRRLADDALSMEGALLDPDYWRETVLRDALRLLTAFALAFPIAWDREQSTRIMGIRTFSLVALGACAYVLIAEHFLPADAADARARIMQGLLAGIGFLGAGAILKQADRVRGTTTAASIWITGAVGAAAGHGEYVLAAVLSAAAYALLKVLTMLHGGGGAGGGTDDGSGSSMRG